jgi:hypothetical protein
MQMLYNSESFVVVRFDVPAREADERAATAPARGGYEIVDKSARKEIFIEGALAAKFQHDVQALIESDSTPDQFDDYIAGYVVLAQHPVTLH